MQTTSDHKALVDLIQTLWGIQVTAISLLPERDAFYIVESVDGPYLLKMYTEGKNRRIGIAQGLIIQPLLRECTGILHPGMTVRFRNCRLSRAHERYTIEGCHEL